MSNTQTPAPWPQDTKFKDRVLVIVPSRDRPKQLASLVHSVLHTSENADVCVYLDDDQALIYGWTETPPARMIVERGPRLGPVAAANMIARKYRDRYAAFGFVPDDATFTTPGWDAYVLMSVAGGPRAVAPAHATQDVDMPFVSDVWLERVGYFAWPGLYHWGWPSLIAALGDATGWLRRSAPSDFWIDHPAENSSNRDKYPADIVALYDFFASHFLKALTDLRGIR